MKLLLLTSLALLVTPFAVAGGDGWMTDFEAAKKKATAENKSLLVDFTGSDWCDWCIKLNDEVFQHDAFKKGVADSFVLVELDYPQDKSKMSEETLKQNDALQKEYQVQGFPTILLMDAKGLPFAHTGYQAGGPEKYVSHLNELLENKTKYSAQIAAAEKLEGVEKAQALIDALALLPESQIHHYQAVSDQISTLDTEDKTGFTAARNLEEDMTKLEEEIGNLLQGDDAAKAPVLIEQFISDKKLTGDDREGLLFMKLQIEMQFADNPLDLEKSLSLVDSYITDMNITGRDKQELLGMKVGPYIRAEKFDDATALINEIIAIDPKSEVGVFAEGFKARLQTMKEEAQKDKEE